MDILHKLQWRYATKKFDPTKSIPEEDIQYLLEGTRMTASSLGLQAYKIINIEDKKIREKLIDASMGQNKVATASNLFVFAIVKDINIALSTYLENAKKSRGLSEETIAEMGKKMLGFISKKKEYEIREWLSKQTYIALGNLLTLCAEKNIDACPMEGFLPNEYNKILGLDKKGLASTVIVTLGYRSEDDNNAHLKKIRQVMSDFVIKL